MSDRYWGGGTSTDPTNVNNWSDTDGGATPASSVPGTGDHAHFTANGDGNACTLTDHWTLGDLTVEAGYTSKLDLATYDLIGDDGADILLAGGGEFDAGTGTISITNGTFSNKDQATYTRGTSHLELTGQCTLASSTSNDIHSLTITAGAIVSLTDNVDAQGTAVVNGYLNVGAGASLRTWAGLTVGAAGIVNGAGTLKLYDSLVYNGLIQCEICRFYNITTLPAGRYAAETVEINTSGSSPVSTALEEGGDYFFEGKLLIEVTSTGALTIDNTAGAATVGIGKTLEFKTGAGDGGITIDNTGASTVWSFYGDIVDSIAGDGVTWTSGSETVLVAGVSAQDLEWPCTGLPAIVVTKTPTAFQAYDSNPVFDTAGEAFINVFKVRDTWHAFGGTGNMYHWSSSDLYSWGSGTELTDITDAHGVANAWIEDEGTDAETWYIMYRMDGSPFNIGLATSVDGNGEVWTPYAGNPVIQGTSGEWDGGQNLDPAGCIKVGGLYIQFYSVIGNPRRVGRATATDPRGPWTKDPRNPIFDNGRFCGWIWKKDGYYWYCVPHYSVGATLAELELYRDTSPTFYPDEREYMGVLYSTPGSGWASDDCDTPCVVGTADLARDDFSPTDGELLILFAGQDASLDWRSGWLQDTGVGGALSLSASLGCASFTIDKAVFDPNGQAITTTAGFSIGCGARIVDGDDVWNGVALVVPGDLNFRGHAGLMNLSATAEWTANVGGTAIVTLADIAYLNASAGSDIDCYGSTDSGNNSANVNFLDKANGPGIGMGLVRM